MTSYTVGTLNSFKLGPITPLPCRGMTKTPVTHVFSVIYRGYNWIHLYLVGVLSQKKL